MVYSFIKLFAGDAKLYAVVDTVNGANIGQEDLSRIDNRSDIWQIRFNYTKCNHMHLGKDQQLTVHTI